MFTKRELTQFLRDRIAVSLFATFALTMIILMVMTLLNIHVSDVQLPVRFSGYGSASIYRDRWYSLLSFGLFALLTLGFNGFLILKLHSVRRGLSLGLSLIGITIGIVSLVVAAAVFRLAAVSL